jgi:hypothetical protein
MTIDQVYTLSIPVASDDGKTVEIVPVIINVRLQSKSEVAARIASADVKMAIRESLYLEPA